jgi:hypothetical protein
MALFALRNLIVKLRQPIEPATPPLHR